LLFWRGAAAVTADVVNVIDAPEVSAQKLPARERWGRGFTWRKSGTLAPGKYGFWAAVLSVRYQFGVISSVSKTSTP
jgi:hypothetical protein